MNTNNYEVIGIFAGCGGLDTGFSKSDFNVQLAIELDPDACNTYKKNHPETEVWNRDIKTVKGDEIRKLVGNKPLILLGGSPCQSFSIFQEELTGPRGIQDERGKLIYEYLRLVKELQPEVIVFENVKNIVSKEHLPAFKRFIEQLSNVSGLNITYNIMQAHDYGVPQLRERVIVIGTKSNINPFSVIPKLDGPRTLGEVLKDCPKSEFFSFKKEYAHVMQLIKPGQCWNSLDPKIAFAIMKEDYRGICKSCNHSFKGQLKCPKCGSHNIKNGRGITSYLRRLSHTRPSPTVCAVPSSKVHGLMAHPFEERALSIREAARIQTFPDDYVFCGNIFSQQKQVGNAVPVNLAKAIAIGIKTILTSLDSKQEVKYHKEKSCVQWILDNHENALSELEKDFIRTCVSRIRAAKSFPDKYYVYLKEIINKLTQRKKNDYKNITY
ncbi:MULTISPECIES: DNA cytosine methyltransferase [Bacillus cereus group]|uniref:DNA (cytosine-5-)-methyltransferase n=2 Tax=Bacillus cereus group TaxID=86661 RepID=A0A242WDC0_BACTU|nr:MULTISPECIES: DNA (cytosine-5-)-methyltransferase [Bacillus cereus group]MEB9673904.1 DNA cytosine methyltransferase [Bacillus anthracis]OTW50911.1 DNA (cytosine-5-)-methyltransferase [Bacillus thuringiensis serovar mexicanensis]OTX09596.1 DNA (cytosine-5-)-methyltransferase [Bacillus thuringiensis serovar monterrey]